MTATAYDDFLRSDPTESYSFKLELVCNRVLARITLFFLVEVARLCFLTFHDRLENFLEWVALAEDQSRNESEYKVLWEKKQKVAHETARLIEGLAPLRKITYKGTTVLQYIASARRLEELELFVEATNLEERGELILAQARKDFLRTFGRHQLSKHQRLSLLEKHKELARVLAGTTQSTS